MLKIRLYTISIPLIICTVIILLNSCKKEKKPSVSTNKVTYITNTTAQCGGMVTDDGGAIITIRGVCWSTSSNPTTSDSKTTDSGGTGSFISSITNLIQNTTYYIRAYATNIIGTAYGNEVCIKTWFGAITDYEGNVYETVQIGNQVWMAENLKTIKLNDGTSIQLVTNNMEWEHLRTPGYCWYNNDEASYKDTYGALYNWYTVNIEKLCPTDWHVPTDSEWTTLIDYLGGPIVAGGKLKEIDTTHWSSPNAGATNESGFTALPGGNRYLTGGFVGIGQTGTWWSSTEASVESAWFRYLSHYVSNAYRSGYYKWKGKSVRCVRN